jgi:hypothetical protein
MIQCHAFNSFTRTELRQSGPYVLSQFVGGMAAVLFLFMAGMTLAFQMDGLDRRETLRRRRWAGALRRAGFVTAIAFAFRISNWISGVPRSGLAQTLARWEEVFKVDILNCMGAAMAVIAVAAAVRPKMRAQFAVFAGLAIACAAPLVTSIDWGGTPQLVREYMVPNRSRFPLFPWAAYLAFGVAAGVIVKRRAVDRQERLMQWFALLGFVLVFAAQYFSNLPFSIYERTDFWTDSPALVLIRTGVSLLALAGAYLWTEYCAGDGWSWMQALGKTSLLVYWAHIVIVYGDIIKPLKHGLSILQVTLATAVLIGLMVLLAAGRLWWKGQRGAKLRATAAAA